jgi:hypothetical protein
VRLCQKDQATDLVSIRLLDSAIQKLLARKIGAQLFIVIPAGS